MKKFLAAFWEFTRPHTIIGTSLSLFGLFIIAQAAAGYRTLDLAAFILALVSCLGANIYIVGLNQLQDVEIDRINKPYLPLAAGSFSMKTGWIIVLVCGLISVALAAILGIFLLITVLLSLTIGTMYSLPPARLKRFPFWASFSIFVVRGLIVNIGIYLHFNYILSGKISLSPRILALTAFMFGVSLLIAWFKDIPDVEGDRIYKIRTFAIRLGQQKIFTIGTVLLSVCYLGLIAAAILSLPGVNRPFLIFSQAALLIFLWLRSARTNPRDKEQMTRHYYFIWKLFYLEYLVYPAACVLAS